MRFVAALAALLLPVQAAALTCAPPSVARSYRDAAAAPQDYLIVEGRLTFDLAALPQSPLPGQANPPEETLIDARLTGKSLSSDGFSVPFEQEVTLQIVCFGPWCGSVADGEEMLAFVERHDGTYLLSIDPCGGHAFRNPTAAMRSEVIRCFDGSTCEE